MKKTRLLCCLIVLLAVCCVLSACTGAGGGATTTTSEETTTPEQTTTSGRPIVTLATTEPEPDPKDMPKDELLLLNGVNISSYRIVYAQSPLDKTTGSNTGLTIRGDIGEYLQGENKECDFDYQTAVRLRDLIKEAYGYELEIVEDAATRARESKYEILIGDTNRRSTKTFTALADVALLRDEYVCTMSTVAKKTTQYVICGGDYGATWHAIDEIEKFLADNEGNTTAIDLSDVDKKSSYDFKVIATVGDSITRGSQSFPDGNGYGDATGKAASWGSKATATYFKEYFSYPAVVQRQLWKTHLVFNCAIGGLTVRQYTGSESAYYANHTEFKDRCLPASKDYGIDLVLYMLGTNDIHQEHGASTWNSAARANFTSEVKNVFDKILVNSPDAQFVMMNAPHRCNGHNVSADDLAMRAIQLDTAAQLKAGGYNVELYDMDTYTATKLSSTGSCASSDKGELDVHAEYYNINTDTGNPDRTHPNYKGYAKIAEGMLDLIDYKLGEGEAPAYMIEIG